jgi:hypothetical protein
VTDIFCGKLFHCPASKLITRRLLKKNPEKYWLSCLFTVKHRAGMAGLRTSPTQKQPQRLRFVKIKMVETSPETKDPSGGTTGRVKLYGRWGGWALAPDTASLGRDYRSHIDWSRRAGETFKRATAFFNFPSRLFCRRSFRRAMIGFARCRSA